MSGALPAPLAALADDLAGVPGVVAVTLAGSRATATHGPSSDWDLGVYYRASRRPLDPADVRALGRAGYVSALGEWGPVVNGGAWLTVDGLAVDLLFRDLDLVERWRAEAEAGRFDVLPQSGALVGAPTYGPVGELALCRPLSGELPRPAFPEALAREAPERWRGRAAVALTFAGIHAGAGDVTCCAGMLAAGVLCAAHARLAARREWALSEKRLVARAGLSAAQALLAAPGGTTEALAGTVRAVAAAVDAEPLRLR
jgi:predicted nucleotidyltransferase